MASPVPVNAALEGEHSLVLTWSDGRVLWYGLDELRADCPCAPCNPEPGSPHPPRTAFSGIRLTNLSEMGSYALQLSFSDGHSTGIYTFERLLGSGHEPGDVPPAPAQSFDV